MRVLVIGILLGIVAAPVRSLASCVCRCVDGEVVPICTSSLEIPPICPPRICPIVPPAIPPIQPPVIPPVGTTRCEQRQVWSETRQQYVWREICE